MNRRFLGAVTGAALASLLSACAYLPNLPKLNMPKLGMLTSPATPSLAMSSDGWATMIDGERGLDLWQRMGDANWRAEGGAIVADQGKGGFLVSKQAYRDFELRAEFWAATDTNSGIFIRASDRATITAANAYEVNIWDIRPEPKYGTGAIVDFAAVPVPLVHRAGGRWNTLEIEARGDLVIVRMNGVMTANMRNGKFAEGPFALQFGPGVQGAQGGPIKWRKVQLRTL